MTTSIGPLHGLGPIPPPTPHAPPANLIHPDASSTSSIQSFIQQNKKTLLVSAAAAAAVGAGYYYYSTNVAPKGGFSGGAGAGSEKGSVSGGKKKKKSKSKSASGSSEGGKKSVNDPDGPLLEEVVPPVVKEKEVKAEEVQTPKLEAEEEKRDLEKGDAEAEKAREAQAAAKKDGQFPFSLPGRWLDMGVWWILKARTRNRRKAKKDARVEAAFREGYKDLAPRVREQSIAKRVVEQTEGLLSSCTTRQWSGRTGF
jgi:hypothetical protein